MSLYLFSSLIGGKRGVSLSIMAGTQVHGMRYSSTRYSVRKGQVLIAGAERGVMNCGAVGCVQPDSTIPPYILLFRYLKVKVLY